MKVPLRHRLGNTDNKVPIQVLEDQVKLLSKET